MLEKMNEFFNKRTDIYEKHQLNEIYGAKEFYPFTASALPTEKDAEILDLGCGTGLELDYYFKINPTARVTCIDIAEKMLCILKEKFADKRINVILGSYFEVPLGNDRYSAAVSVESLHHFSHEEKLCLYKRVRNSLRNGGYFLITDYFAKSEEEEEFFKNELFRLWSEEKTDMKELYHYDTPFTIEHEMQILKEAGFSDVQIMKSWKATYIVKAFK